MPHINYEEKEIAFKLVYFGPGMSGKTTNLLQVYRNISSDRRGELFYEFVLSPEAARRFGPFYPLRVLVGHLSAYHGYSTLLPLLGYLWPIQQIGMPAFVAVFALRGANFAARLKFFVLAEAPERSPT